MKTRKAVLIGLGSAVAVLAFSLPLWTLLRAGGGPAPGEDLQKQTRYLMNTYVTIHAGGAPEPTSKAIGLALDRMQEVDVKFNCLNPKSPIYAFNHAGARINDPEILRVVRTAIEISRACDGAFDLTVAPLIELWGFSKASPQLPPKHRIEAMLHKVGYRYLVLDEKGLSSNPEGIEIHLGGIAKGYAVAEAVKVLKAQGIDSALIDAGGDVFALGNRSGKPWKVGIRKPRGEGLLGYLEVEDQAVMGSGDYERFFIEEGERYHHILDPHTGYPAKGVISITVISPDPVLADAWATALFVMGPDKGLKMAEEIADLEAIMVTSSGKMLSTSRFKKAQTKLKPVQQQE